MLPHITPPLAVNRCRAGYFDSSAPVQRPPAKVPRKSPGSMLPQPRRCSRLVVTQQPKPGHFLSRPHPFLYVYAQVKTAWARGENIGTNPRNSRCRSKSESARGRKIDLSEESPTRRDRYTPSFSANPWTICARAPPGRLKACLTWVLSQIASRRRITDCQTLLGGIIR